MMYTCEAGSFTGYETERCVHVRGIRYAFSERWCDPVPYRYPEGVHACTEPAPFSPQPNSRLERFLFGTEYETFHQEESAQYLSITMPKDAAGPLPVMVWYHGGGFKNGCCDSPTYNYEYLSAEQNLVLVGINYRLGILGFTRDKEGNPGHPGLLDAIEGLRWVKKNIQAFGGDPENITLFGQSAGAELVRCITLSQGTGDLFRRAILQSDPIGTMTGRKAMEEEVFRAVRTLPEDSPVEDILTAQKQIVKNIKEKGTPKYMVCGPHFGIAPLPDAEDIEEYIRLAAKDHELLIGCTEREVSVYGGHMRPLIMLDNLKLTRDFIESQVRKLSRRIFNGPCEDYARQYSACGGKTWEYLFSWHKNRSFIAAGHTMDLPLLFGADEVEGSDSAMGFTAEETAEAGRPMRKIWADFAREGKLPDLIGNNVLVLRRIHPENRNKAE